jgi:hypothetical protein
MCPALEILHFAAPTVPLTPALGGTFFSFHRTPGTRCPCYARSGIPQTRHRVVVYVPRTLQTWGQLPTYVFSHI